jgi:3-hydroxybutyryl-CoA dehydrogenase
MVRSSLICFHTADRVIFMDEGRIVEEGVATAEEVDQAIKYGFGFRLCVLGLLEFVDLGGLDILYYADQFLYSAFKK